MTNRIAFIDTRVENYQSLIDGLAIGTEVIILNPAEDGLAQILASLQGREGLDARRNRSKLLDFGIAI